MAIELATASNFELVIAHIIETSVTRNQAAMSLSQYGLKVKDLPEDLASIYQNKFGAVISRRSENVNIQQQGALEA